LKSYYAFNSLKASFAYERLVRYFAAFVLFIFMLVLCDFVCCWRFAVNRA